tara:strand:- start:1964 stop:2608 length:645 start_codon:yes stop_codon:yes gene_type:complete
MFSKFLILIFFLANINIVNAENNSNTKSWTDTLTEALTKNLTGTETETVSKVNVNKKIIKNENTNIILNGFFSNYKLVGEVKYIHLFWDLYDAKLITETGSFDQNKFALILKYNTKISKKSVVRETLNQLKKQKQYNEEELDELTTLLNKTFQDIKVGNTFIGIKENNTAYFYFEDEKVLETKDLEFINLFFNIWLREDSENPTFTKKLLGKNN